MTDVTRHPDYQIALDRSRPLEERRAAYARWAVAFSVHTHPGRNPHAHPGGDRPHDHGQEVPNR